MRFMRSSLCRVHKLSLLVIIIVLIAFMGGLIFGENIRFSGGAKPFFLIGDGFGSAGNGSYSLDILNPGTHQVKKLEDVVIESYEMFDGEKTMFEVNTDLYYPYIRKRDVGLVKFPLVIITHPTIVPSMAPARKQFDYISEHLASHGYIVVVYEWSEDLNNCEVFRNAEREGNIVEYLAEKNSDIYSPLYSQIDLDKIGLIGHSNGAFAQYYGNVDQRVNAFVGLSGLLCEWGGFYREIVDLTKPFMYIGATKDQLRANTKRLKFYELWPKHTGPKAMMDVLNGDHWQFTDDYTYYPDVVEHYSQTGNIFRNLYDICQEKLDNQSNLNYELCVENFVDREKQHLVVKYFVTAFFEVYLKGREEFKTYLEQPADEVESLIVNYEVANM